MERSRLFTLWSAVPVLALLAGPVSAQTSLDLLGDKDCFGTGAVCTEGVTLPGGFTAVTSSGDPAPTDTWYVGTPMTWSHSFAYSGTGGFLTFRTAGIGDVSGPYDVFVDGMLVGIIPFDGIGGHVLVETFTFALSAAMMADGYAEVSFTPGAGDGFAIDYAEITAAVPEPGTVALMAAALASLLWVGYRRRERFDFQV